jgi:hypothetical protein
VVPSAGMQDHPAAAGHLEPGAWAQAGLSAQQLFEVERASEVGRAGGPVDRLLRLLPWSGRHPAVGGRPATAASGECSLGADRHLHGLEAAGGVTLNGLRTPSGRRRVDHLIVAPSGIYAVEDRAWRGQVAVTDDQLYVDGRRRAGVPEGTLRTASAVSATLADELAPAGPGVTPVICLPGTDAAWRTWQVQGVIVVCGRGLGRMVRERPAVMGADTVVRLALVADRLLETD